MSKLSAVGEIIFLNIGPEGNGEIPDATIEIFRKVGPWVERNAESIYGTTANPFGELPWGYCTVKANKLYLFVRDWPNDKKLNIYGLQNKMTSAYLLIDKSTKLKIAQTMDEIKIELPPAPPDNPLSVVVLELDGVPEVNPPLVLQDPTGKMELDYMTAITRGNAMTRFNRKGGFHISKMKTPEDNVDWLIRINKPGKFRVDITYAANKDWEGKTFEIFLGKYKFEKKIIHTGDWYEYKEFPVGYAEVQKTGDYTFTLKPEKSSDTYLMYLKSITLVPVKDLKREGWGAN